MTTEKASARRGKGRSGALTASNAKAAGLKPPGPRTAEAVEVARARQSQRPLRVAVHQASAEPGVLATGPTHSDVEGWGEHLTATFGTTSRAFCSQAMLRLANATKDRGVSVPSEDQTNAALALMGAIDPENELEAAIGEQIIATHIASLDLLARARSNAVEYVDAAAAYVNMATKVSRTMALHVETLAKLRSGGKQQVIVKHVYVQGNAVVGDGNQAVFGGVETGGRGGVERNRDQSPAPLALAGGAAASGLTLWSEDPQGLSLPIAGSAREAALSDAWRHEPGRAPGKGERPLSDRAVDQGAEGSPRPRSGGTGLRCD